MGIGVSLGYHDLFMGGLGDLDNDWQQEQPTVQLCQVPGRAVPDTVLVRLGITEVSDKGTQAYLYVVFKVIYFFSPKSSEFNYINY